MSPKIIFLSLCILSLSIISESQIPLPPPPPPPTAPSSMSSRADSLLSVGNIKEALTEYSSLVKENPDSVMTVFNYVRVLSLSHQADSAFRYLHLAMEMEPSVNMLINPDLIYLRDDRRWKEFEEGLINLLKDRKGIYFSDPGYASALWRLRCLDQYSFYETSLAARKMGPDSPVVSAMRKLQEIKNEATLKDLEVLLSEKGWPKRSQVGEEASSAAFLIIQHSNADVQEKYLPMFGQCCRENEASWQQYALMYDRMRMNRGLPQRYGTHPKLDNRDTGKAVLYPLEDESMVDQWRSEIGLEPLNEYLEKAGIEYQSSAGKNRVPTI